MEKSHYKGYAMKLIVNSTTFTSDVIKEIKLSLTAGCKARLGKWILMKYVYEIANENGS